MIRDDVEQRWKDRAPRWVAPAGGVFDPGGYEVVEITGDKEAAAFIGQHHYSASYPNAVYRFGLVDHRGQAPVLAGVAVLSYPVNTKVLTNPFPDLVPRDESLELGRFVLKPEVMFNGESWFLARVYAAAAELGIRGLVMFSDPVMRTALDGRVVMPGHVGTIYKATNCRFTGRATASPLWILRDGTVFNKRTAQKVRRQEQGADGAVAQLMRAGAPAPRAGQRPADYLAEALGIVTVKRIKHPGNLRYLFLLDEQVTTPLPSLPYPGRDVLVTAA